MPSITIKNIPDTLYQKIKEKAVAQRRSINSEIIHNLEQSITTHRISEEEVLYEARKFRKQVPQVLSEEEIQAAKEAGRE